MADMDDDGTYMAVGNGNLSNIPLQVKPNMISGSATSTGSFGNVVLNGTGNSALDIHSTVAKTRHRSEGYYGYVENSLGYYIHNRDQLILGDSDGSHIIQFTWGPIYDHKLAPSTGMSDFKIFAGTSGSNSMNGDNSGGAGFGFYTSGGGSYLLAIQPFFNGSGCDVIHNFEDVSSGVKTEGFRLNSSGHLLPGADDTHNLGSSSKRWSDVFAVQTTTGGVFETGLRTEKIGDNPTGTIVSWRGDGLVPCDSNEDELVMGVIKQGKDEPIVMGAEPVLVTGKVEVGDYIVTSDKIGHGKSVKRGYLLKKDLFGKVIAQALEPSDDSDSCLIKCMIRKM